MLTLTLIAFAGPAQAGSVFGTFSVTNDTGSDQDYVFTFSQILDPSEPATQYIASSASVSLLDSDGNGIAMLSNTDSDPVVQAFINGTPVVDLLGDVLLDCDDVAGCIQTETEGPSSGALAAVVANELGLTFRFTLSPGDSATGLARFEIVPEPATALLLVGGLAAMAARRRFSA